MADYYTILTEIGKAKVTNSQITGDKLSITNIVIGDGSGKPSESQTELKSEVWRGQISMVSTDEDNPNWIVIEGIIPSETGGFTVREVGILDDNENLIAVGIYPETYKPVLDEGSSKDLYLRMIIEVSNAESIEMKVDPTVAIPSQSWVKDEIEKEKKTLVPKSSIGKAGGIAEINDEGKVVDGDGNPVEGKVKSVNGKEGDVNLSKNDIGLGKVRNIEQLGKEEQAVDSGKLGGETPSQIKQDAQTKANMAEQKAKDYADEEIAKIPDPTWDNLKEKPTEFKPESHTHKISDINGLRNELNEALKKGINVGKVKSISSKAIAKKKIELSWGDPEDTTTSNEDGEIIILAKWAGTQLRRKEDNYPVDETDGELIVDSIERNEYQNSVYVDENLDDGTTYYYMAFPYTEDDVFTVDSSNRTSATAVDKTDQDAPSKPAVDDVEFDRATVTGDSGSVVSLDKITWHTSPHTFTDLSEETKYTAYAKFEETDIQLESPISEGETFETPSEAPGPGTIIGGNETWGLFGTVPASEFITGDQLASELGITSGTSQHSNIDWLKFKSEGKITFSPLKPIRYGISWNQINDKDAAYGDARVTINGMEFKVRLWKGANEDPADSSSGSVNHGSEWNKLMLPIHERSIDKDWEYKDNVESDVESWPHDLGSGKQGMFTDKDLLTHYDYGDGSRTWCQEKYSSYRLSRGYNGVSDSGHGTPSSTSDGRGWRPVLELLE